ncbi:MULTISPECIES: ribosome assembly RNA-binding protein YhbY [unclassified Anaerococcus]|uniref:Ribosome assembly RNA-binding protein YhbY n=1 Tax=Anaerococcus martiniensis TaxID=3115615 RepID=A0ABW9M621_9FIRM|nr:ribosome assembly RNA-binding protein YhbY [Anaerococcus sp. Marseille-Q5996]
MLTGKQRAMLKAESHDYKPVINIGKFSLTDDVIKATDEALEARELIKIKILNNNMDDPKDILSELLDKLNAEFVNHVGNIFTIYRKNDDNKFGL